MRSGAPGSRSALVAAVHFVFFRGPGSIRSALLIAVIFAVSIPGAGFLAQAVRPDPRSAIYRADFHTVFSSALAVLDEQKIPLSDRREPGPLRGLDPLVPKVGLVRTGSVKVDQNRLRELVAERFKPLVEKRGRRGGRYVLTITITSVSRGQLERTDWRAQSGITKVTPEARIVVMLSEPRSVVGGQSVPSSMRLEMEFLARLAAKIQGPAKVRP